MCNKQLNLKTKKKILTLFSRAKIGLLRLLRKRDIKLYSDFKRKRFIREKCFKLNYSIPANSMKDPVEFLRMHKRKKHQKNLMIPSDQPQQFCGQ